MVHLPSWLWQLCYKYLILIQKPLRAWEILLIHRKQMHTKFVKITTKVGSKYIVSVETGCPWSNKKTILQKCNLLNCIFNLLLWKKKTLFGTRWKLSRKRLLISSNFDWVVKKKKVPFRSIKLNTSACTRLRLNLPNKMLLI